MYCSVQESGLTILPIVEDFLPERDRYIHTDPYQALQNGSYIQIPLIIGISDFITDYCKFPNFIFHLILIFHQLDNLKDDLLKGAK